jgi:hypothetical protein
MKFSHVSDEHISIDMELPEDADLDEVLDHFTRFLRAVGYAIRYDEALVLGAPCE